MIRLNKERVFSVPGIFSIFIFFSWLLIQGFRYVVPGEAAPLPYFASKWRYLQGIIQFLSLYPALALTALVLPFGIKITPAENLGSFSAKFLQHIKGSILTALAASGIYALVSLLILPVARDYESSLRFQGRLYEIAKENAWKAVEEGDWEEVAHFVRICEQVWPESPEFERLGTEANIRLEEIRLTREAHEQGRTAGAHQNLSLWPHLPDETPPDAAEAIAMAEIAMDEERYFDAHWLANLAGRMAVPGSAETTTAARLASMAWNAVNSLEPNAAETEQIRIFRLKREGYEAMIGEDWIRAYYIFLDLRQISPNDPDVVKFLVMSEQGAAKLAFFHDELDTAIGTVLTGSVFSLPYGLGRMVIRFTALTLLSDSAYGTGMEMLAFGRDARPAWRVTAPYVKMLPFGRGEATGVNFLCRVLDRENQNISWGPAIEGFGESPPSAAQLAIDTGWEDFLLLADLYQGNEYYPMNEILAASRTGESYGYLTEVFQAEFLRRLANQILFQAMAIMSIIAGWRYRAKRKVNFILVPMMVILPAVYNGLSYFSHDVVGNLSIWSVLTFGLNTSLVIFGIAAFVIFAASMIILAAQHE